MENVRILLKITVILVTKINVILKKQDTEVLHIFSDLIYVFLRHNVHSEIVDRFCYK